MNDERTKDERALDALIALSLRPFDETLTTEEILKFMAEYDAGLHPLSEQDKAALDRVQVEMQKLGKPF